VANRACYPRFAGISAPGRLLTPGVLQWLHQPILEIFHQHFANAANGSAAHKLTGMAYRRIAGVVMREREDELFLLNQFYQTARLFEIKGHRFVANDVNTLFEKGAG